MKRTIAISLSPNVFPKDIFLAIKTMCTPWKYNTVHATAQLEAWFKAFFSVRYAFSYTNGRGGLYEILEAYGIGKGDEVILQSFTCVALPNAILAVGATPIYGDILDNLTMDPESLEKKITKKTKAIIMQHTFGIPSDTESIGAIAKKHSVPVIEDCAHGIGIVYKGKKLGQFGDVTFFSFGRDKAFSSVFGGMVITNDARLAESLANSYKTVSFPSLLWTAQQLFHPIAFSLILPLYDFFSLGKLLIVFFQKLRLLSFPVSNSEKKGVYKKADVKKLPGAIATLALSQLDRLAAFNKKREEISAYYLQEFKNQDKSLLAKSVIPYLRFPLFSERRDEIIQALRKEQIYVGKWYANIIDPVGVDFAKIKYTLGSCPNAEGIAKRILNLPTMPRMHKVDAQKIVSIVKQYV